MSRLLTLFDPAAGALGGGASTPYLDVVLGVSSGLIAYWPMNETVGTNAIDANGGGTAVQGYYQADTAINDSVFIDTAYPVPRFDGTGDRVWFNAGNLVSAGLDGQEGTLLAWFKVYDSSIWTDGAQRYIFTAHTDATNWMGLHKNTGNNQLQLRYRGQFVTLGSINETGWLCAAITWSLTNDQVILYKNGAAAGTPITSIGTWAGAISNVRVGTDIYATNGWNGWLGHVAVWNRPLSALEVAQLAPFFNLYSALFVGDSKTNDDAWVTLLLNYLDNKSLEEWRESVPRLAVAGYRLDQIKTYTDDNLASVTGTPKYILCNIGANDLVNFPISETTWKSNYAYIIDAYRAKWPSTKIYIAKPWRSGYDDEADTMAGWIDAIVSGYSSGVYVGHDERVWFKPNVATYSDDGVHYNAVGQDACFEQWRSILDV